MSTQRTFLASVLKAGKRQLQSTQLQVSSPRAWHFSCQLLACTFRDIRRCSLCYVVFLQGHYLQANDLSSLQVPKRTVKAAGMSGSLTMQLHIMLQQEEHESAKGNGRSFLEVHSLWSCSAYRHVLSERHTVVHMHALLCRS